MSRRTRVYVVLASALFLTACDRAEPQRESALPAKESAAAQMRAVQSASGEMPSSRAVLREVLPDSAYAYARIPSTWGLVGTPTGGALDRAVGSVPYVEAVRSIREGLAATVIPELPEAKAQFLARLFLQHATSPIEIAALAPSSPAAPIPDVLVTAKMAFAELDAVNGFLVDAAKHYPAIQVVEPVRADAAGLLAVAGLQAQVQWDAAESRIYLLMSTAPTPTMLADTRGALAANADHAMRALESGVDASGQGLFVWLNAPKLVELAKAMEQQGQVGMRGLMGLAPVTSLGVGVGTSGGIHRMKAVVEMPRQGFRAFLPVVGDAPTAEAAGEPGMVAVFGLPSPSDLAAIEAAAALLSPPEKMAKYRAFKQTFAEKLGFTIEDIFAALGQDVTFVSDEAGHYFAVRLKDAQKFQTMLEGASQRFGLRYEQREIAGHTYHHLVVPSLDAAIAEQIEEDEHEMAKLAKRYFGVPSHLYWSREGDYLMLASLPQVLIDRNYIAARTPIGQWLQKQQRLEPTGALLLASGRNEGLPAIMYRLNLEMLSFLGDLVERPVDMFALPTPREASIPEEGAFGIKVTSTDSQLAFELAFESNPLELLAAGNGYTGVAMVGVMAAVAVPAYRDYTLRAEVAGAVGAMEPLREYIEEFAQVNGRYPNAQEIGQLDLGAFQTDKYTLAIDPDSGAVVAEFFNGSLGEEPMVVFSPDLQEGGLAWSCVSAIEEKYLPKPCR